MNKIQRLTKKQLFLPVFSMLLVMLINVLFDIKDGNPALTSSLFPLPTAHFMAVSWIF